MKINVLKNINIVSLLPKTKGMRITAGLTILALLIVSVQAKGLLEIYQEGLIEKNELASLETRMKKIQSQNVAINKDNFDVDYYLKSIDAYGKVNQVNLSTAFSKSKYDNAMQIEITFANELNQKELYDASYAFSKLGYIDSANPTKIIMHVEKFTKDDAIKQIQTQNGETK